MARIKEKVKVGKVVSSVWNWVVFGVLCAVVVAGIVFGIMAIVDHFRNDGEDVEKTYAEIYESEKLHITLADLEKILDNDQHSELIADTIYVYVYSANTDKYTFLEDESYAATEEWVNKCITAFEAAAESNNSVKFYLINIETEENQEYMDENTTVGSITLSSFGNPKVLLITGGSNIKVEQNVDVLGASEGTARELLADAIEALK